MYQNCRTEVNYETECENMYNMEMVNKLKRVLNSKNRFTNPDQLFNLIKFETTSYISVNKQINPIRQK